MSLEPDVIRARMGLQQINAITSNTAISATRLISIPTTLGATAATRRGKALAQENSQWSG